MPLIKGHSKRTFDKNVATLISEGEDPKRAAAVAYDIQKEATKRKRGKSEMSEETVKAQDIIDALHAAFNELFPSKEDM